MDRHRFPYRCRRRLKKVRECYQHPGIILFRRRFTSESITARNATDRNGVHKLATSSSNYFFFTRFSLSSIFFFLYKHRISSVVLLIFHSFPPPLPSFVVRNVGGLNFIAKKKQTITRYIGTRIVARFTRRPIE